MMNSNRQGGITRWIITRIPLHCSNLNWGQHLDWCGVWSQCTESWKEADFIAIKLSKDMIIVDWMFKNICNVLNLVENVIKLSEICQKNVEKSKILKKLWVLQQLGQSRLKICLLNPCCVEDNCQTHIHRGQNNFWMWAYVLPKNL